MADDNTSPASDEAQEAPAASPDSCRWCGRERRGHAIAWSERHGFHVWFTPTDRQRKARMLAARAAAPTPKES